ncbi:MAG: efflux RND transporter permease subunit [Oligoflexia bacterium]|nr:efflux RND transporter permease subunit [Oligoflexia bacterium]
MKNIIRFFYSQHLFANLLTILVFIFGIYSLFTIRKDLFPKVEFDITVISAVFAGASPDQVEKLIVNPLEETLREVDGVKKIQSQALDNRAVITLILDPDARAPQKTNDDIQRAVDKVEDYPLDAEKPVVLAIESGQSPIVELSISSKDISELELRDLAKYVANELANVPGVARITKDAWRKKEFQVLVDQAKATKHHISLTNIIDAISGQNIQMPAGDILLPDGKEMSAKTDGEYKSKEHIEDALVRLNFEGYGVRIKDVAEVREGLEKPTILYRSNGVPSFKFTVIKKENADALKTMAKVREKMAALKKTLPPGVDYTFVNDFTFYLKERLGTLSGNMAIGIVLVCLILALFLPFRVALVVAIGIPFSMLSAICVIQYLGFSLNLVSLIGLIIVSGMLVDDTIVVTENIYRRLESGEDRDEAIVTGATEMIPPVVASVLTTVAAFAPMLFMSGIFGKFIFEIPLLVILPLLFSLVEAFVVAPGHMLTLVGSSLTKNIFKIKEGAKKVHWYDRFLPYYRSLIALSVRKRKTTAFIFFLTLVLTGILTTQMRFILFPPEGIYTFIIRVDAKAGAPLKEMSEIVQKVEPYVATLPKKELIDYTSMIGIQQTEPNDPFTKRASHYAQILVNLTPEDDRDRTVNDIITDLRKKIPLPEGATRINFEIAQGGPPQGKPISVNIFGDDFKILRNIADDIKAILVKIEGVQDIEDSEVIGKKEVKISPIPEQVRRTDLSVREIATTVRATFAGVVASSSRNLDEEIDIRVQIKPPQEDATQQLKQIHIGTQQGNLVPLEKIATFSEADSRLIIQHEKYKRILNVSAQVDTNKTTALKATETLQQKLKKVLKKYPPQYEIGFGGENEDTEESMKSLARAFAVAGLLIFMILVLTFQSFLQPLLVLLALPLGFMGVVFALLIHGRPLSFMSMLGIIALAGVIVNNTIVYIDFFNAKKKEGLNIDDALIEAATTRLRPIILTSLTTVLGLMPTAYGIGGNDDFVMSLALALGWGLMIGSILTVLIFPAVLKIVEDIKIWGKSLRQK